MKTQPSHRKSGFTLVELLVVIAIIAVLAGAGFAAGNAAIQKARKTTTMASCIAIESAVNNFYTEYGTMPVPNLSSDSTPPIATNASSGKALLNVLLGYTESGSTPLNSRAIKFLSVKDGKRVTGGGTGGLLTSGSGATISADGLYDPWGGPYNIMLDGDYDESITPKPTNESKPITLNGRRCAVWSEGADYKTKKATADDVTTWK